MLFNQDFALLFLLGYTATLVVLVGVIALTIGGFSRWLFRLRGARARAFGGAFSGTLPGGLLGYLVSAPLGPVSSFLVATAGMLVGSVVGALVGEWLLLMERQQGRDWWVRFKAQLVRPFGAIVRGLRSILRYLGRALQRGADRLRNKRRRSF